MKNKKKSIYEGSSLQLRYVDGYADDFSENFNDTKSNERKLLKYMELRRDIFPNSKQIQLWRHSIEVIRTEKE